MTYSVTIRLRDGRTISESVEAIDGSTAMAILGNKHGDDAPISGVAIPRPQA